MHTNEILIHSPIANGEKRPTLKLTMQIPEKQKNLNNFSHTKMHITNWNCAKARRERKQN